MTALGRQAGLIGPIVTTKSLRAHVASKGGPTTERQRWRALLDNVREILSREVALPMAFTSYVPCAENLHALVPLRIEIDNGRLLLQLDGRGEPPPRAASNSARPALSDRWARSSA